MAYVATLQKPWISGAASLVQPWVDTSTPMVASADDFDSAIGTATVTNASTATPDVSLPPKDTYDISGWLRHYTRYTGCNGKTPEFTLNISDLNGSMPTTAKPVWRVVDDTDPNDIRPPDWTEFDNLSGTTTLVFSNNTAFTDDEIEVALFPRWRYLDTQHAIAYAAASSYGSELQSAVDFGGPANVYAQTTVTSQDDNSAPPTTLNQYCVLLDDTSVSPAGGEDKLNILVTLSQHSSEDQGNYAGWELLKQYIDGGTDYDWLRQHCRFYVYDINPAGRYYGAERRTQEDSPGGDVDANRAWGENTSTQVDAAIAAIDTDMARVDVVMDYHGRSSYDGALSEEFGIYRSGSTTNAFVQRLRAAMPARSIDDVVSTIGGSMLDYGQNTLLAQVTLTPEFPYALNIHPGMEAGYGPIAHGFADAFEAMVDNSELTLASTSTTITGSGAVQSQTIDQATLTQGFSLSPASLAHSHVIDQAALTQAHNLTPAEATHAQTADTAALTQAGTANPDDTTHAQTADTAALTQASVATPEPATQAQPVDEPGLTQAHSLAPAEAAHAQTLDQVDLTQAYALVAAALEHTMALGNPVLLQAHSLAPAGATHDQTVDASALIQAHTLTLQAVAQAHRLDAATLIAAGTISTQRVEQGQTVDLGALTQQHQLAVDSLSAAHTVLSAALVQDTAVAPGAVTQAAALTAAALTQYGLLSPNDALQAHQLAAAALAQTGVLAAADIEQLNQIAQAALTQAHQLAAADMTQLHEVAGTAIVSVYDVAPAGLAHSHALQVTTLTQQAVISPGDVLHPQLAAGTDLTQFGVIAPFGLEQAQLLDLVGVAQTYVVSVNGLLHGQQVAQPTVTEFAAQVAPQDASQPHSVAQSNTAGLYFVTPADLAQAHEIMNAAVLNMILDALEGRVRTRLLLDGATKVYAALDGRVKKE